MTSRQRLLALLRREPIDRVPISTYELSGWNAQSFENTQPSYRDLMDFIRAHTDGIRPTHVSVPNLRDGEVETKVENWDDCDQHMTRYTSVIGGRTLTTVHSRSDDIMTTWVREHTCKSVEDLLAYVSRPWAPGEPDFSHLERAYKELDGVHGIPMLDMGDPLCEVAGLFSMEDWTIFATTETDACLRAMDILHERTVETLRRILKGPVKDCLWRICGAEYATPPFMAPELFAKFFTRYDTVYCRMMREAGVYPRIHSHGRVGRVLDQIVQSGAAALDPVEPPPDGDITIAEIKKRTGNKLCLMGGIELKHLEAAGGEYVENLVRDLIAQGKPGGNFVIMPTAAPINFPVRQKTVDNYKRFIETALECGTY